MSEFAPQLVRIVTFLSTLYLLVSSPLSQSIPYHQTFGLLSRRAYDALVFSSNSGKFTVPAFNDFLSRSASRIEKYVCLPQPGAGLRFRLVCPMAMQKLIAEFPDSTVHVANGIRVLYGGCSETGPPHKSPHPIVSQWLIDRQELHSECIPFHQTTISSDCYEQGFGERSRCKGMGQNLYLGRKASEMANVSPVEGPGQARQSQYHRQYYRNKQHCPFLEKRAKALLSKVNMFGRRLDYVMNTLLPMDGASALWTQGIEGRCFAYVNDCHVDEGDRMKPEEDLLFLRGVLDSCQRVTSEYTRLVGIYVDCLSKMIGLGFSTTCAYQHVYHPGVDRDAMSVHQYFVMPGIGCCCPVIDKVGHEFRAYAFSHYSSACLVVRDGYVVWKNDGSFNLIAWGRWVTSNGGRTRTRIPSARPNKKSPNKKKKPPTPPSSSEASSSEESSDTQRLRTEFRHLQPDQCRRLATNRALLFQYRYLVVEAHVVTDEAFWITHGEEVESEASQASRPDDDDDSIELVGGGTVSHPPSPPHDDDDSVQLVVGETVLVVSGTHDRESSVDDDVDSALDNDVPSSTADLDDNYEESSTEEQQPVSQEPVGRDSDSNSRQDRKQAADPKIPMPKRLLSDSSSDDEILEDKRGHQKSRLPKVGRLGPVPEPYRKPAADPEMVGPVPTDLDSNFAFYVGVDKSEVTVPLSAIGEVHDVRGDGNCGFYCLLLALRVVLGMNYQERPEDHQDLRRVIQRLAYDRMEAVLQSIGSELYSNLNQTDRENSWNGEVGNIYSQNARYWDERFMKKQNAKGDYLHSSHWMGDAAVLPVFASHYEMRVVVYSVGSNGSHRTDVYDGRRGGYRLQHHEGLVQVQVSPGDRTFGLLNDGTHYEYVHMSFSNEGVE